MRVAKAVFKLYLYHVFMLFLLLVVMGPLWFFIDSFPVLYSCIMSFVYGCTIYSVGWNYGKKDGRKIPGSYPDLPFPFKVSIFASIIPIFLLILRFFYPNIWQLNVPLINGEYDFILTGNRLQGTVDLLFKTWYFPFGIFLGNGKLITYPLAVLVLPILFTSGYFVGLTKYKLLDVIAEKLIFSSKKEK